MSRSSTVSFLSTVAWLCSFVGARRVPPHTCSLLKKAGKSKRYLSQHDFENGTVIISEPNQIVELTEDIVFNPNRDISSPNQEGSYFCLSEDADLFPGCDLTEGSFRLGFFAAISIEADDIIFDLKGYSMSVDKEFLIQQRFFSLIGVGKTPFIHGQGPSTFGSNLNVSNIEIKNGHLGSSAHHGIHANLVDNIKIHKLTISDFEVAGIQLNGFTNACLKNLDIGPSSTSVPVRGRYSQARFGLLSFRDMMERIEDGSVDENNYNITFSDRPGESVTAVEVVERLIEGMDLFFEWLVSGNTPTEGSDEYVLFEEAAEIFSNTDGLPDGSAVYGILLNSAGVAVDWFGAAQTTKSEKAVLQNIKIHDLNLNVEEVVAYVTQQNIHVTGPYKGVLPMQLLLDLDAFDAMSFDLGTDGTYHGNILADAQIVLAKYGDGSSELQGTTINNEFLGWAQGLNKLENGSLICNGDDMFHMNKGAVGLRIDRVNGIQMTNLDISNVNNLSPLGSDFCNTNYSYHEGEEYANRFVTHPQTPEVGSEIIEIENNVCSNYKYQGRVSRGISMTDVSGWIKLKNLKIEDITSSKGSAIGIELLGSDETTVHLKSNIKIEGITACSECTSDEDEFLTSDASFPNNDVFACGMVTSNEMAQLKKPRKGIFVNEVEGPLLCQ